MKKSVGGTDTVVEVGSGGGIAASFTAYEYTATANQTTFSGSDNNSTTLAYNTGTPPKVQVFMNGILLDEGSSNDYTATNGTSVVLNSGADAGDLIQIHAYKSDVSIVSNLNFSDNQKLKFGDSLDLEIFHDGSHSRIKDTGTGNLILNTQAFRVNGADDSEGMIKANQDGNVELYYNGVKKFETTSTGIDVSGNLDASGAVFFNSDLRANNVSNKLIIKASSTTTELHAAGSSGIVFKDSGNGQTASLDNGGNLVLNGLLSAEDNIYLTDAGTVRAKLLLNSSDRDNVELRAESIGSTMKFFTAATEALELDASQKASFKGSIVLNSNGKVVEIADAAIQWYSYPDSAYKQAKFRATDYQFKNGGNTAVMTVSSGGNLTTSGIITANGTSGSSFYGITLTRSSSGTTTPDLWGSSGTLVIGTSSSDEVLGMSGTAATFYGTLASGAFTSSGAIVGSSVQSTGNLFGTNGLHTLNTAGNGWDHTINRNGGSPSANLPGGITSGNITTTGYLRGPSTFTIDPAAHGDDTGTVVIAGNLQIDGTTTTINSTTLTVDDKNITLASGAANAAAANGAGLTVDGANATWTYSSGDDAWASNKHAQFYTGGGTGSLSVGRSSDQALRLYADDNYNRIFAYQDSDTNGDHFFDLVRSFAGSGKADMRFMNGTAVHMLINKDGNVGINETNPTTTLTVGGIVQIKESSNTAFYGANYVRMFGDQNYYFRNTGGATRAHISMADGDLNLYNSSTVLTNRISTNSDSYFNGGNVGIGTNSPSSPLHVTAAKNDGWLAQLINTGTGGDANGLDIHAGVDVSDYILRVREQDGTDVMAVKYGGNVGIGTTTPGYDLDILDTSTASNTGAGVNIAHATQPQLRFTQTTGNYRMYLGIRNNDLIIANDSGAEKVRFEQNGNVGIGTDSPNTQLQINNATDPKIRLESNESGSKRLDLWIDGGTAIGYIAADQSASQLAFKTAGTERMRIDSTGNVGIGTTSPNSYTNQRVLTIDGTTHSRIDFETGGTLRGSIYGDSGSLNIDAGGNYIRFYTGNTEKMRLTSNGFLGIGTQSPLDLLHLKSTSTDARQVIDGHTGFDAELKFAENGTVKYTIGHDAASDNFVIGTTNVDTQQRLVINSAGNVGIGVTSIPTWANLMTDGTVAVGGTLYMKTGNAIQALSAFPGGASDLKMQTGGGKVTIGGPGGSTSGHLELYGRYSGSDPKLSFRSDHPTSGNTTVWDMARITADDGGNYNGVLHFQVAAGNGSANNGAALATAMTIQDTKYVGIGTTNPDTNLEVDIQNGADGNGIHITSTSTTNDPTLKLTRNGSADRFQLMVRGGAGSARLGISAGTNLDSGLNLGSNNGLSIGTVTAAGSGGLLVDNDIKSNSRFGVGSGGSLSDAAIYKNSDTNTGIYWPGTDQIALTTAGSNRLHIASNGGVSLNSQSQLTTGGNARLSIIDSSVQLSMGASNNDMSYIRKQGAGQFAWQTYNSGNSGILQLQPYGGNVTINTTAAVSGHALSVSGRIGGLTYVDSYLQFTGGNAILKANDDVILGYSSYVYVKQAGKVGLGTSDPKSKFQVYHAGIDTYAVNTSATSAAQVDTFSSTEFRSARFTVQITNTTDSTYQITEILLIHDGTTPSMTEYSTIFTGSAREASFDADIVSGNVRLLATPASTDSMQFKVVRHSILV